MISQKTLLQSKHYNALDHIQQKIVSKKETFEQIDHGINMSNLKGFEYWVEKCQPNSRVKEIVSDLVDTHRRKCDCWLENKTCKCKK